LKEMRDPYNILRVPQDATLEEIEVAYEKLFDRYESKAQMGDAQAVAMLERLNEAYDILSDPQRRASLNVDLTSGVASTGEGPSRSARPRPQSRSVGQQPARQRTGSTGTQGRSTSQSLRTRPRASTSRSNVEPARTIPLIPILLLGILGFALAAAVTYLVTTRKDTGAQAENRGGVVATVNDQPIYQQDFLERAEIDKQGALKDEMFAIFLQTQSPISQSVALETLRSDSLDRLINFEVLMQQARKEGRYPVSDGEQRSLIEQAKASELKGQTFEQFLKSHNITEGQYNRRVIRNVVYSVMADAHLPKEGTSEARRAAFFQWICEIRKSYDVKIQITFTVSNPPCTSDLPPEIPLPGIDTVIPEPESTVAVPLTPIGPQGPATTPTK
jgi:hypothetical protein